MLREEGMAEGQDARPTSKFWSIVGGVSGGAMGFILANVPGALAGAVAGNRLGAVRDARGRASIASSRSTNPPAPLSESQTDRLSGSPREIRPSC